MSQCLNPNCRHENSDINKFCCQCGSSLLLKSRPQSINLMREKKFEQIFLTLDEYLSNYSSLKLNRNTLKLSASSEQVPQYSKLYRFLATEKWQEADLETANLIVKMFGKKEEQELSSEKFKKFLFLELRKIDRLWLHFSKERFGFSVQGAIWQQLGGKLGVFESQLYEIWAKKVGWQVNGVWKNDYDLNSCRNLPNGFFPGVIRDCSNLTATERGLTTVLIFSQVNPLIKPSLPREFILIHEFKNSYAHTLS